MYPSGPISHERHFLPIFLEIEASLRAELEEDDARISEDDDDMEDDDDETSTASMPNSPKTTNNTNYDNKSNNDNDEDDGDEYEWTVPMKSLPKASELCANANYQDTKDAATSSKRSLFDKFKMPPRRQTDDTVDLDKDEEDILRQIYRHDSLGAHMTARAGRLSSAFARRLSDCMQNLAQEAVGVDAEEYIKYNDDDSIGYVSSHDDDSHNFKVREWYEMNVFADHSTTRTRIVDNNDSMGSITTELTSNAKKKASRRNSATSTDAMNDILFRALEESSSNGCKLSDDHVVPTEVEVGNIARRMGRRFSRRRSFINATAA